MRFKATMKVIILTALLLTIAFGVSAQVSTPAIPPDLIIVQKKWRFTEISNASPSAADDAFRANDEQREFARATTQNMRDNEVRAAQGLPPLPPPTRTSSPSSPSNPYTTKSYVYEVKVKNTAQKTIRSITWEYVFFDNSTKAEVGRRDFISRKKISADETKVLKENSTLYPTVTIDASKGGKKFEDSYSEQIIIRKIEYEDGSVWTAP